MYKDYKDDAEFLDCICLANLFGNNYTADYYYNLPIERYNLFCEFALMRKQQKEEKIKALKNKNKSL